MTSERVETIAHRPPTGAVRRMKTLVRGLATVSLVAVTTLSIGGGFGCAEETFKCCECAFACMAPNPGDPASMVDATFYLCDCPSGDPYTYEECGIFCKAELTQAELDARAAAQGFSSCTLTPKQNSVLAKNSCSPGWPVGE